MMRFAVACLALGVAVAAGACKDEAAKQAPAPETVEDVTRIASEEEQLLARREALVKTRQKLRTERVDLERQRREAVQAGGDTSQLDERVAELLAQERELEKDDQRVDAELRQLATVRRELVEVMATASAGVDQTQRVAARESGIAAREKDLAARESELARREADLAKRERALVKEKAESCAALSPPTIITQTVDAKGSTYTKRDVEPLIKKARKRMSRKGILLSDLPAPAQGLEREATKAMAEGDFGRARFAASQLVSTVNSIRVNKSFISGKIARLNQEISGKALAKKQRRAVDELFRDATKDYGDGRFSAANGKLNRIYAVVN